MTSRPASGRPARGWHLGIALLGLLAFGASLAYGGWFYVVRLGQAPAAGPAWAIPANVALFTAFALHHSLLARSGAKDRVTRVVPPHLERSLYVWTSSLLFAACCAGWQPVAGTAWRLDGALAWLARAVQVAGVAVTLAGAYRLDVLDLGGVRQVLRSLRGESVTPHTASEPLTRRGPYGWVRHPIYFGWLLMTVGSPTMTAGRLVFTLVTGAYLVAAIPWEERSLTAEHGQAYLDYQRDVRWKMLPFIY